MNSLLISNKGISRKAFFGSSLILRTLFCIVLAFGLFFAVTSRGSAVSGADFIIKNVKLTDNQQLEFILTTPYTTQGTLPDSFNVRLDEFEFQSKWFSTFDKENTPLTILFLIDLSTKWDQIEQERAGKIITEFLRDPRILKRGRIGVMTFGEKIERRLDFTNDPQAILASVSNLQFADGEIKYPLALLNAVQYMATIAASANEQRHIVLISDGTGYDPNLITDEKMAAQLDTANIRLSALVQRDTDGTIANADFNRIFQLAKQSGGYAVSPIANNNVNRDLAKILIETIKFGMIMHARTPDDFIPNPDNTYELILTMYQNWSAVIGIKTQTVQPLIVTTTTAEPTPVVEETPVAVPTEQDDY